VKFETGGKLDLDHCTALTHEFFRCDDAFKQFCHYAELMITKGKSREISYRAYNSYASFIHHLYEFLMGCHVRDAGNTNITNKKGDDRIRVIEGYVMHHVQRVMNQYRDAIKNGTAPSWVNDIGYYDVAVPDSFAKDFREYRNKICGHVAFERSSALNLSEFYQKYHKFLYYIYRDSIHWWGNNTQEFPDLKDITAFSVMVEEDKV
jgi:hypothetical protein